MEYHFDVIEQIRLKKEQGEKERKRKDKAEAHLYTVIKVCTLSYLPIQLHLAFKI